MFLPPALLFPRCKLALVAYLGRAPYVRGRGCRSLVTCQRGLDTWVEWQASTSILTPGLILAKSYSQLVSSILLLLLTLAKLYSQLVSSILLGLAEPAHQVQAH